MSQSDLGISRAANFTLDDTQQAVRDTFASFFERGSTSEVVRGSVPLGFDEKLWRSLQELRAVAMGVPEEAGGDGAGLVELVLAAEQAGRFLAPVPFVETVVAARLLARTGAAGRGALDEAMDGTRLITVALHAHKAGQPELVPAGAIADGVVALVGDELVLLDVTTPPRLVANQGDAPLAFYDLADPAYPRTVLASGAEATALLAQAVREWKLVTAGALIGLAAGALAQGLDFAINRIAFGVPITNFQAISHPLVNVSMAITGARRLLWKAAWYADHEPDEQPGLIPMAYLAAVEAGMFAPTVGTHVQGGFGFTLESDMHLFFKRAKGWVLVAGDPRRELDTIAEAVLGPVAP